MKIKFYQNGWPDPINEVINRWRCFTKGIFIDHYPPISSKLIIEKPVSIGNTVRLVGDDISIGKYSYINHGTVVFNNVKIGRYTSIAYNATIGAFDHPTDWLSTHPVQFDQHRITKFRSYSKEFSRGSVTEIGNDVWICANAFIGRGVKIGDGAIVAAGAIVVKDVEPYAIVGGCPAKVIRYRFNSDQIKKLLHLKWWNLSEKTIEDLPFENIDKCIEMLLERFKS